MDGVLFRIIPNYSTRSSVRIPAVVQAARKRKQAQLPTTKTLPRSIWCFGEHKLLPN
jgi:hypothetical protein